MFPTYFLRKVSEKFFTTTRSYMTRLLFILCSCVLVFYQKFIAYLLPYLFTPFPQGWWNVIEYFSNLVNSKFRTLNLLFENCLRILRTRT